MVSALTRLFIKIDTRSKDGSFRKLLILFISFGLPGVFLPILILARNNDATGFDYTFLTYLFYSLILSFTITNEFDNIIVTRAETDLLSVMPVKIIDVINAKLHVLIFYICLISVPMLLPGAYFYYKILNSAAHSILYYISGLSILLFVVFSLLLIFSIALKNIPLKYIGLNTLIFQLVVTLILIIGYQYMSFIFAGDPSGKGPFLDLLRSEFIRQYFPHSWYAFLAVKDNYIINYKFLLKIFLPFVILVLLYYSLKIYLLDNYLKIRERFMLSGFIISATNNEYKKPSYAADKLNEIYFNDRVENAAFHFIRSMFRRDRNARMNIISMVLLPAALGVFAFITDQLPDPFINYYFDIKPAFHISIFVAFLIAVHNSFLGMKTTNNKSAQWIFEAYPVTSKKIFINGLRKFLLIYLIIPASLLLFIIFSLKISLLNTLIHTLFIFSAVSLYNTLIHIFSRELPFSRENSLVNSSYRIGSIIFPLIYGILFIVIQSFVYSSFVYTLISILVLIAINFFLSKYFFR